MKLVERHIITKENKIWKQIDNLCFISKNLYNAGLYEIKTEFLSSGKWIRYNKMDKLMKEKYPILYKQLPASVSQQILMLLDKNLKSYFQSIKSWKRDNKSFTGCPEFPHYKHKTKGRNILIFVNNPQILKNDVCVFPKITKLSNLKTKVNNLQQVRIIPQNSCYVIEVVYTEKEEIKQNLNKNYLSIDIGLNNLSVCTTNINIKPFIINGKPLKSINQYYNKKLSSLKSDLEKRRQGKTSNKIKKLTLKRNNKINHYLHNTSKYIVDYCVEHDIDNIVIGYNKHWKTEINLGKKTNQNFVQIPFMDFIQKIEYKAKLRGLNVVTREESYTSKCSAIDLEPIKKLDIYKGKRIKRGMFKTEKGILINSDVNGSLNILRKETNDVFLTPISIGLALNPVKINFNKDYNRKLCKVA